MREALLQYIWERQLFEQKALFTCDGRALEVIKVGTLNRNRGPDFLEAMVKIDGVTFYGHVEVHIESGDWYRHKHDGDEAYDDVVLHVVWQKNTEVFINQRKLPTFALFKVVNMVLAKKYQIEQDTFQQKHPLGVLPPQDKKHRWKALGTRALVSRMNDKYEEIHQLLMEKNRDTEATTYVLLAKSFGFKVNSDTFKELSGRVPFSVVQKNIKDLMSLEALFFGQAGFLDSLCTTSPYLQELSIIHKQLQERHKLPDSLHRNRWKFFRLRPANFPTVRIAQFARFLHKKECLFSLLMNTPYDILHKELRVYPSTYWRKHYAIGKKSNHRTRPLGKESIDSIIINTLVPLLIAYGKTKQSTFYFQRVITLLKAIPAEKNSITQKWAKKGMEIKTALDSQKAIALSKYLCKGQLLPEVSPDMDCFLHTCS